MNRGFRNKNRLSGKRRPGGRIGMNRSSKEYINRNRTTEREFNNGNRNNINPIVAEEFRYSGSSPNRAREHYFDLMAMNPTTLEKGNIDMTEEIGIVVSSFVEQNLQLYLKLGLSNGQKIFHLSNNVLIPPGFSIKDWIHKNASWYCMDSGNLILAYFDKLEFLRMECVEDRGNLKYDVWGLKDKVLEFQEKFLEIGFKSDDVQISWAFLNAQKEMETFRVPLRIPDSIPGAYPWVKDGVEAYTERYINSSASILVLIGPPGTGKTTFIKELIKASNKSAMVTYDTGLLFQDSFFAQFITGREDLLILEDADEIMGSRRDGNTLMHRFLNASDGLISGRGKKIIFTTNLPSVRDIDTALIRPGRCHDILHADKLNAVQAQSVLAHIKPGLQLPADGNYSLAEIFQFANDRNEVVKSENLDKAVRKLTGGVGFLG